MIIDVLYNAVNVVLNKDQRGKLSPFDFNNVANQAVNSVFDRLFDVYRRAITRRNKFNYGAGLADDTKFTKQAIEFYEEEKVFDLKNGELVLDKTIMFVDGVFADNVVVTASELKTFNALTRTKRMMPSLCSPIYTNHNGVLKTSPKLNKLSLSFIRRPKPAKWTYNIVSNLPLFNPSAPDFSDVDIHPSMVDELFKEILLLSGVHLKDLESVQVINALKQAQDQSKPSV